MVEIKNNFLMIEYNYYSLTTFSHQTREMIIDIDDIKKMVEDFGPQGGRKGIDIYSKKKNREVQIEWKKDKAKGWYKDEKKPDYYPKWQIPGTNHDVIDEMLKKLKGKKIPYTERIEPFK